MHLGVNTVLFAGFDLRTALEHIKWAGFGAAEISAIAGMCEHVDLDNWERQAPEIRDICEDLELQLTAMEEAALDEDRLRRAFDAAAALGIPVVNIGPGGTSGDEDGLRKIIDRMARLAHEAHARGVVLCVKSHVGAAIWNTPTTLRAMAEIDSPGFGIDMDPSHIHRAGEEPKMALEQVISRVRHVHIRDCKGPGPPPGPPELQACGRGDIDLRGYCRVLKDSGYTGPVNLEVIGAKDYPLTRCAMIAAESRGYLNACLQGH